MLQLVADYLDQLLGEGRPCEPAVIKRARVLLGHPVCRAEPNLTPTLHICQCELLAAAATAILRLR